MTGSIGYLVESIFADLASKWTPDISVDDGPSHEVCIHVMKLKLRAVQILSRNVPGITYKKVGWYSSIIVLTGSNELAFTG